MQSSDINVTNIKVRQTLTKQKPDIALQRGREEEGPWERGSEVPQTRKRRTSNGQRGTGAGNGKRKKGKGKKEKGKKEKGKGKREKENGKRKVRNGNGER